MGMTTNTHNISLAKLSELFNMPVYILGIQPADISFGEGMVREVSETAERITGMINRKTMKFVRNWSKMK
jgi:hydrogenase 3 maturation protease